MIDFTQHRFGVIGLGETGISILKYLDYQKANIVSVFDTRDNPPNKDAAKDYQLHCGKLAIEKFADIDIIVISPGISIYEPVLQQLQASGKKVIGDIELFALAIKSWKTKVIGITGSNGKTTVTALTGHLAKAYGLKTLVAGNIGAPVLNNYLDIMKSGDLPELIVLELSSFQLETTYSLDLAAATVLNISEDHLDRYRDLLEYAYAKANIFNNAKVQILNQDDVLVSAMQRPGKAKFWFGKTTNAFYHMFIENDTIYLAIGGKKIIETGQLNLLGMHNYLNCLASLALLKAIDIDIFAKSILDVLTAFKGLEHRMQKIVTNNGITFVEDSKGTNVGAVIAGVSGLANPVHLILGGDGKGQDFTPLRELVMKKCKSVAVFGQDKDKIMKVLEGLEIPIKLCASLQESVNFCTKRAMANEYVVLSPACASWDMFTDYKHRAQVFVDSVYANIK